MRDAPAKSNHSLSFLFKCMQNQIKHLESNWSSCSKIPCSERDRDFGKAVFGSSLRSLRSSSHPPTVQCQDRSTYVTVQCVGKGALTKNSWSQTLEPAALVVGCNKQESAAERGLNLATKTAPRVRGIFPQTNSPFWTSKQTIKCNVSTAVD